MKIRLRGSIGLGLAWALALILLQTGCGETTDYQSSLILADQFELAEIKTEIPLLDLGNDQARDALKTGWSWNETSGDLSFVWGVDSESSVSFFSTQARALELRFRCRPLDLPDGLSQVLAVSVNSIELPPVQLDPGMRVYSVDLPESSVLAGQNTLRFQYAHSRSPFEIDGSDDRRQLAVAWDWIGVDLEAPATAPGSRPERDSLLLPAGSQSDFFFIARVGDRLTIDSVENTNEWPVSLAASYHDDTTGETALFALDRQESRRSVDLPIGVDGPARLSFRAVARDGRNQATRPLEIRGGRIESRNVGGSSDQQPSSELAKDSITQRPNILIYLVDTLRADRLGAYGDPNRLTPALDTFATEAIVFEQAVAHSSWTKPSVASILTGLLPDQHGVNQRRHRLPNSITTLAESLKEAGYETAGYATNPYLGEGSGLSQGFDHFDLSEDRSDVVVQRASSWLSERDDPSPFFLYAHTVEPHDPYLPPEEFRDRFAPMVTDPTFGTADHIRALANDTEARTDEVVAALNALYDAEVAFADQQFGLLLGVLRDQDLFESSMIVFVSDHGEAFYEHGVMGHGWDLHREVIEVPLIVRAPGQATPQRVSEPVQLIDLFPTILDLAGLEPTPDHGGMSLLSGRREISPSGTWPEKRPLFSYMEYDGRQGISVVLGQWKLIEPLSDSFLPRRALFDRLEDPNETINLADRYPALTGWLAGLARKQMISLDSASPPEIMDFDEKTERQLRALGYVE